MVLGASIRFRFCPVLLLTNSAENGVIKQEATFRLR